ncbi:uncharacterized protein [Epargyreus clarus]|uniref:uncharacterized protein n=1 Tax=Epargyreus clarus TaxID=520877 RepID=UPI003C30CAC6
MCYVCNCFSWALDLVQRTITFCLGCCTVCVICLGLVITVMAGIAYGYNYSFAEYINFSKSDVTIYMRRGQFHDNPSLEQGAGRRMSAEDDMFAPNIISDYEERISPNKDSEPLANKWLKYQDAREYAKKLTKYSDNQKITTDEPNTKEQEEEKIQQETTNTLHPTRRLSKFPFPIPTTVWRSGSSEIVMRKFLPLHDITEELHTDEPFYKENKSKYEINNEIVYSDRQMKPMQPDIKIRFNDIPQRKIRPLGDSETNSKQDRDEEELLEGDEYNNIYKPV